MNILEKIIEDKRKELKIRKSVISTSQLEKSELFERQTYSLKNNLLESDSGIIAEHKRRSPSRPEINQILNIAEVVSGYEQAGASGISILTDTKYFGGSLDDLILGRGSCDLPILRKEFILDEYQLIESKAYGADVILLLAAVLNPPEIKRLGEFAKSLGLEVILEIRDEKELEKSLNSDVEMIGVNNRNLKNFEVSIETSKNIASQIPDSFVKISESGISHPDTIRELKSHGYKGFLVGENFMKSDNPGQIVKRFIQKIENED